MDLLAPQQLDDLLAELAEPNAPPRELGLGGDQAEDVPPGRVAVHAQEQVGAAQVEERQRVRLDDLAQVHEPAELVGGRRDGHREDLVARLGRGQQVADRADPADPGRDPGHLPERPPLAELLEAPELGDVEAGVAHLAGVVELDRDLGVALDPRHGVDQDLLCHGSRTFFLSAELEVGSRELGGMLADELLEHLTDPRRGRGTSRNVHIHRHDAWTGITRSRSGGRTPGLLGNLRRPGRRSRGTTGAGRPRRPPAGCAWR